MGTFDATYTLGVGKPLTIAGQRSDKLRTLYGKFTFSASYATGGESLDLTPHFSVLKSVFAEPSDGYDFIYDLTNKKLKAFVRTTGLEVAATTNLSAQSPGIFALGESHIEAQRYQ